MDTDEVGEHAKAVARAGELVRRTARGSADHGFVMLLTDYAAALLRTLPDEYKQEDAVLYRRLVGQASYGRRKLYRAGADQPPVWYSPHLKENADFDFMVEIIQQVRGTPGVGGRSTKRILVLPGGERRAPRDRAEERRLLFAGDDDALNLQPAALAAIAEAARAVGFTPTAWTWGAIQAALQRAADIDGILLLGRQHVLIFDEGAAGAAFVTPRADFIARAPELYETSGALPWLETRAVKTRALPPVVYYYSRSREATADPVGGIGTLAQVMVPVNGDYHRGAAGLLDDLALVVFHSQRLAQRAGFYERAYKHADGGAPPPELRFWGVARVFGRQGAREREARRALMLRVRADNTFDGVTVVGHDGPTQLHAREQWFYVFFGPAGGHDDPHNPDRGTLKFFPRADPAAPRLAILKEADIDAPSTVAGAAGGAPVPRAKSAAELRLEELRRGFYEKVRLYDEKAHFLDYLRTQLKEHYGAGPVPAAVLARAEAWVAEVRASTARDIERVRLCAVDVVTMDVVTRTDFIGTLAECSRTLTGGVERLEVYQRAFLTDVLGVREAGGAASQLAETLRARWRASSLSAFLARHQATWTSIEQWFAGLQKATGSLSTSVRTAIFMGTFLGSLSEGTPLEHLSEVWLIMRYASTLINFATFAASTVMAVTAGFRATVLTTLEDEYGSDVSRARLRQDYWQTIGRTFALATIGASFGFSPSGEWRISNMVYTFTAATAFAARTAGTSFAIQKTSQLADRAVTALIHRAAGRPGDARADVTRTRRISEMLPWTEPLRARTRVIPNGSDVLDFFLRRINYSEISWRSPLDAPVRTVSKWVSYMIAVQVAGHAGLMQGAQFQAQDATNFSMPVQAALASPESADELVARMREYKAILELKGQRGLSEALGLADWGADALDSALDFNIFGHPVGLRLGSYVENARLGVVMGTMAVDQLSALEIATDRIHLATLVHTVRGWNNAGNFLYGNPVGFAATQATRGLAVAGMGGEGPAARAAAASKIMWDLALTAVALTGATEKAYEAMLGVSAVSDIGASVGEQMRRLGFTAAAFEGPSAFVSGAASVVTQLAGASDVAAGGLITAKTVASYYAGTLDDATRAAVDLAAEPTEALPATGLGAMGLGALPRTAGPASEGCRLAAAAADAAYGGVAAQNTREARILAAHRARRVHEKQQAQGGEALTREQLDEIDVQVAGASAAALLSTPAFSEHTAYYEAVSTYADQPLAHLNEGGDDATFALAYPAGALSETPLAQQIQQAYEVLSAAYAQAGLPALRLTPATLRALVEGFVRAETLHASGPRDELGRIALSKFMRAVEDRGMISTLAGDKKSMQVFTTMLQQTNPLLDAAQLTREGELAQMADRGALLLLELPKLTVAYPEEMMQAAFEEQLRAWGASVKTRLEADIRARAGDPAEDGKALVELWETSKMVDTALDVLRREPEYFAKLFRMVNQVSVPHFDPATVPAALAKVVRAAHAPPSAGRGFGALTTAEARNVAGLISWGRSGSAKEARQLAQWVTAYGKTIVAAYADERYTRRVDGAGAVRATWARLESIGADFNLETLATEIQELYAGARERLTEESAYVLGALEFSREFRAHLFESLDEAKTTEAALRLGAIGERLADLVVHKHLIYLSAQGAAIPMPHADDPAAVAHALGFALGFHDPLEAAMFNLDREYGVPPEARWATTRALYAVRADALFRVRTGLIPAPLDLAAAAWSNIFDGLSNVWEAGSLLSDFVTRLSETGAADLIAGTLAAGRAIKDGSTVVSAAQVAANAAAGLAPGAAASASAGMAAIGQTVAAGGASVVAAAAAAPFATAAVVAAAAATLYSYSGLLASTVSADAAANALLRQGSMGAGYGIVFDPWTVNWAFGNATAGARVVAGGLMSLADAAIAQGGTGARARGKWAARMRRKEERDAQNRHNIEEEMAAMFASEMHASYEVEALLDGGAANPEPAAADPRIRRIIQKLYRPEDLIEDDADRARVEADPDLQERSKPAVAADVAAAARHVPTELLLAQRMHHPYMVFLVTASLALTWASPAHRAKMPVMLQRYMQHYDATDLRMRGGPFLARPEEFHLGSSAALTATQSALHRNTAFSYTRFGEMVFNPGALAYVRPRHFHPLDIDNPAEEPTVLGGYILVNHTNILAVAELQRVLAKAAADTAALTARARADAAAATTPEDRAEVAAHLARDLDETVYAGADGAATRDAIINRFGSPAGPLSPFVGGAEPPHAPPHHPHPARPDASRRGVEGGAPPPLFGGDAPVEVYHVVSGTGEVVHADADAGRAAHFSVDFGWVKGDRVSGRPASWAIKRVEQVARLPTVLRADGRHAAPAESVARVLAEAAHDLRTRMVESGAAAGLEPPMRAPADFPEPEFDPAVPTPSYRRFDIHTIRVAPDDDEFYVNEDDPTLEDQIVRRIVDDVYEPAGFRRDIYSNSFSMSV